MKSLFRINPLILLCTVALVLLCAGLAVAGVLPPLVTALPFLGMAGSVKLRGELCCTKTLTYTHNAETVKDTIYVLNGLVLLAMNSAAANVKNVFICCGRIEYDKVAAQAWTGGQRIYWDPAQSKFTNVYAVGCILAGCAAEAAANPSSTGLIDLDCCLRASNQTHNLISAGISAAEVDADATVTVAIPGLLTTDIATATLAAAANAVYVTKAVCTADTLTVTLSGNGGAGTQVSYQIARALT